MQRDKPYICETGVAPQRSFFASCRQSAAKREKNRGLSRRRSYRFRLRLESSEINGLEVPAKPEPEGRVCARAWNKDPRRGDGRRLTSSVLYTRLLRLIDDLSLAKGDGRIAARMKSLARVNVLILDDWGLEPLDGNARHHLLEILEDRYGPHSTMVTS
jgi:hypothetical protein